MITVPCLETARSSFLLTTYLHTLPDQHEGWANRYQDTIAILRGYLNHHHLGTYGTTESVWVCACRCVCEQRGSVQWIYDVKCKLKRMHVALHWKMAAGKAIHVWWLWGRDAVTILKCEAIYKLPLNLNK